MLKKEFDHDHTRITASSKKTSLERKLHVDNTVICECKGTSREVQSCLARQLAEGMRDPFTDYLTIEADDFVDVKDAMRCCATNGIKRILQFSKK